MKRNVLRTLLLIVILGSHVGLVPYAFALTFSLEGVSGWPSQAHYDAAVNAAASSIDRYNAYGDFNNINSHVYIYYEPGIPTAQANFGGSVGFGGTYPGERVMMHEMAHFLGLPSGNWNSLISGGWSGAQGAALVQQFDGDGATINGDGAHFWPYGLNYDSEGSEINKQRQVAMVYAMRADLGIGPTAHPSTATTVTMTADDPFGTSGFNHKDRWSDGYFAHAGADYFTGNYMMRTPESSGSFTFAGDSLTIENPTPGTGLLYKGLGTSGITTFEELNVAGGWITHGSNNGLADLFQLDGVLNVLSDSNFLADNGNINLLAEVHGSGALTIHPTLDPDVNNRYVRMMSMENTFTGDIINASRFELAAGANFVFDIGPAGENNAITGSAARNTILNGAFEFDFTDSSYNLGDSWQLVTAANTTYGASFNLPGFSRFRGLWKNGSYAFNEATGVLSVSLGTDLDSDGDIDGQDYNIFLANHLTDLSGLSPFQQLARGDFNGDGVNDFLDFRFFQEQYDAWNGPGAFSALAGAGAPEPASASLVGLAGVGIVLMVRRRDR